MQSPEPEKFMKPQKKRPVNDQVRQYMRLKPSAMLWIMRLKYPRLAIHDKRVPDHFLPEVIQSRDNPHHDPLPYAKRADALRTCPPYSLSSCGIPRFMADAAFILCCFGVCAADLADRTRRSRLEIREGDRFAGRVADDFDKARQGEIVHFRVALQLHVEV